jgi:Zn-dependent peptidase ImmA (M78 family)
MRKLQRSQRAARELLESQTDKNLPIDVFSLAREHAMVIETPMGAELSGMLVPLERKVRGKRWAIVVNSTHPRVRQRFTVAHELGHLLLHGYTVAHADRGFKVRFRNARSSDGSVTEEIEANDFAAELLMPADLVLNKVLEQDLEYAPLDDEDVGALQALSEEFDVSQQALSFRLANLLA